MVRPSPVPPSGVLSRVAALDVSTDLAHAGAMDRLMMWLGLYVPTWGTSVVLHVAVILLLLFVVTTVYTESAVYHYVSCVVPQKQHTSVKRPREEESESRGKFKEQESGLSRKPVEDPMKGLVRENDPGPIPVIGIGTNWPRGDLLPEGLGRGPGARLFDRWTEGEGPARIVYVVDRSGSMTDSLGIVKEELRRSIEELPEEAEFHIVFYSTGTPVEMPTRRLVAATERNKRLALEFIDSVIAEGGTDPSKALERAFAVRPDLIYLLTDGEFDRAVVGLAQRLNVGRKVRVNTIQFLYKLGDAERILKAVAADSGGQYKFVSEPDLATLGG